MKNIEHLIDWENYKRVYQYSQRYRDSAGNTLEENFSMYPLILIC